MPEGLSFFTTSIVFVADNVLLFAPWTLAVIVADPWRFPVTSPFSSTDKICSFDEVQVTLPFASAGVRFAVSCVVWNCLTVSSPLIEIPVGATAELTVIVYSFVAFSHLQEYVSVTIVVPSCNPVTVMLTPLVLFNLTLLPSSTVQLWL